jgi:hypothetical protein
MKPEDPIRLLNAGVSHQIQSNSVLLVGQTTVDSLLRGAREPNHLGTSPFNKWPHFDDVLQQFLGHEV